MTTLSSQLSGCYSSMWFSWCWWWSSGLHWRVWFDSKSRCYTILTHTRIYIHMCMWRCSSDSSVSWGVGIPLAISNSNSNRSSYCNCSCSKKWCSSILYYIHLHVLLLLCNNIDIPFSVFSNLKVQVQVHYRYRIWLCCSIFKQFIASYGWKGFLKRLYL